MKFITVFLLSLVFISSSHSFELEANPMVSIGHRFGNEDLNGKSAMYVSLKFTTLNKELSRSRKLHLGAVGLNYQDDKKWAYSISPISVSSDSGLTFGVDYIPTSNNVNGGKFGAFIGFTFE